VYMCCQPVHTDKDLAIWASRHKNSLAKRGGARLHRRKARPISWQRFPGFCPGMQDDIQSNRLRAVVKRQSAYSGEKTCAKPPETIRCVLIIGKIFYYAKPQQSKRLEARRVVRICERCENGANDHTMVLVSLAVIPARMA
jgi:hypothetical protein